MKSYLIIIIIICVVYFVCSIQFIWHDNALCMFCLVMLSSQHTRSSSVVHAYSTLI